MNSYLGVLKDESICQRCGWCEILIDCPANFIEDKCVGCGACVLACPYEARQIIKVKRERKIRIEVNGRSFNVSDRITVKKALEECGYKIEKVPISGIFAPCEIGGCYSCIVEVNDEIKPSCITPVKEGMRINTELPDGYVARRIVGGFMPHPVGGVGTPWYLKGKRYIEVALFTAGCNFRCPQCQNWTIAYRGKEDAEYKALSPKEAAEKITKLRNRFMVDRIAISGGECTLNRKWLIEYLRELRNLNPDKDVRLHVDTNGSLLTEEYLDEMIDAGMTDIGIDLKSLNSETFMKITGLTDENLAMTYKETAWNALEYLIENYRDKIFIGIGIPYNKELISMEEIELMGKEIVRIDSEVQVCVLDYRPEFRKLDISYPDYWEMERIHKILKNIGLKTVICQTRYGYIGP